jgi:hypothetical protein
MAQTLFPQVSMFSDQPIFFRETTVLHGHPIAEKGWQDPGYGHHRSGMGIGRTSNTKGLAPLFLDHFTVVSHSPRGSDELTPPLDADGNPDPTQMRIAEHTIGPGWPITR